MFHVFLPLIPKIVNGQLIDNIRFRTRITTERTPFFNKFIIKIRENSEGNDHNIIRHISYRSGFIWNSSVSRNTPR